MRVFFDASVIIAALLSPSGGSSQLLKYVKLGKITGITSQTVIEEILEEDKFSRIKKSKREIEQFIAESRLIVRKPISAGEIEPYQGLVDIEDAHLIAGANLTRCRYLVTLDKKHLLRPDVQKKFLPLKIISPGQLLEELV
ncbi:putative toxin-antitoxin system toxin component, PIN family [Candidatus Curtissbacteria bacterium RIFCSPLOWO2_02_FULL_40_13b]|uniref:Putative toxin-antitoxin system toxin component, PIN family n=2 Tax=Candidatus Curtissiibacteriota TaxID=1752717 RepID=A0A1F5HRR5_9BACT|nr:MAG: putative toxin-antitoxin system toxin component, PIN family [Candidatus Curtissbacteria bacterium RIFCSPHIGHO2_12_FULL_41_17]OGE06842.1 MAG: putative toxin-antitoxin system toxin component, PIN family [Candidatus Curtissbacteria bacterium RIFCSPLOWO2_02_FULL_40_13b]